jgi:prophage tail gpP-like protein
MLVTTDQYGDLYLTAPKLKQDPVATLGEGDIRSWIKMMSSTAGSAHSPKWEAKFDGRKRFYRYTVYCVPGDGAPTSAISYDPGIPNNRMNAIVTPDTGIGALGITAAWKRSRTLADALTIPFPVTSWYTPSGALWTPGTMVMVHAPSIHINTPFQFLIRKVEYMFEPRGATAVLSLLPPQAYTGDPIPEGIFS